MNISLVPNKTIYARRRLGVFLLVLLAFVGYLFFTGRFTPTPQMSSGSTDEMRAAEALEKLAVRGDENTPGYKRDLFGSGWGEINGCDTRNVILARDLRDITLGEATTDKPEASCYVMSGTLQDIYTGETIYFQRGSGSGAVQIDHVVALSNGWQSGMNTREATERKQFANDPMNLLAVDGPANQEKSDAAADAWLPPNRAAHCYYVARQISVKFKYNLSITTAEKQAMQKTLRSCPDERILR
ncbi:MAG: HNH endonuclease family protein [Candidatus Nomurabacteria bacterium]|jgi:hypothetical protein|nr:HNH endonuclease family protein [Candidatus Nomurabacteria bacterium]